MRAKLLPLLLSSTLLLPGAAIAQRNPMNRPMAARAAPAAPVSELVRQINIPYERFKLANGLTVIVHEDRKAPVVAVSVWYNVGSKDEPRGKTGFAHLFEHLMFNGSENAPGDFFQYLQQIGATDLNGTTFFDRTNYFQTVPTGAIERALFLESDRMGYLLGAVTQEKLDNQRGVVQNEKRQGDNRPGGLVFYEILENLFPEGHPYRHSTIGSMADLDAASLKDVGDWFRDNYGPNNAVLVLAGDISTAQARPLVQKYFGAIPRGPVNTPAQASVPRLTAPKTVVMKDRVAAVQVQKYWPMPGLLDPQLVPLDVAGSVLGGLASSRLDNALVRDEQIALQVSAGNNAFQRVGFFTTSATVKPGVDPALVERRMDEIMRDLVQNGPTEDEVRRAATTQLASTIKGLEQVGGFSGKAVTLAEGQVYAGDPDFYAKTLRRYAQVTPAQIRTASQQWLTRPALTIRLEPGERGAYQEAGASGGGAVKEPKAAPSASAGARKAARPVPQLADLKALDFPDIQRAQLSNGVRVHYAQRSAVPVTLMTLSFNAGYAADRPDARGLQNFTVSLLDEGTTTRNSRQIAEEQERLGATIGASGSADRTLIELSALSANLAPSLDLLADVAKNPAFAQSEVDRVRAQLVTAIAQQKQDPNGIASRALPPLLYGPNHPYGGTSIGDDAAVARFSRDDLVRFQQTWLRPDTLDIFVVSDRPLAELTPLLNDRFGTWRAPAVAKGAKTFSRPPRASAERIVLIDRPGSPQSIISAGFVTDVDPRSDVTALTSANDVLGGNFLSRINMDLRETKGWSYGVNGRVSLSEQAVPYLVNAPVQADRTGDSIAALRENFAGFLKDKGVTDEELQRTIANSVNGLPGRFETSGAVLQAMQTLALYGRPDDYYERLAGVYRGQTRASLDQAARAVINPNQFVWVVVGDASKVRPQLTKLGLPVEVRAAEAAPTAPKRSR
ncbi:MAG TPA: pitrilysin family protein [Allosphingosinicella sp.]|jgi:predicted Zn-dependent peptidase